MIIPCFSLVFSLCRLTNINLRVQITFGGINHSFSRTHVATLLIYLTCNVYISRSHRGNGDEETKRSSRRILLLGANNDRAPLPAFGAITLYRRVWRARRAKSPLNFVNKRLFSLARAPPRFTIFGSLSHRLAAVTRGVVYRSNYIHPTNFCARFILALTIHYTDVPSEFERISHKEKKIRPRDRTKLLP